MSFEIAEKILNVAPFALMAAIVLPYLVRDMAMMIKDAFWE